MLCRLLHNPLLPKLSQFRPSLPLYVTVHAFEMGIDSRPSAMRSMSTAADGGSASN